MGNLHACKHLNIIILNYVTNIGHSGPSYAPADWTSTCGSPNSFQRCLTQHKTFFPSPISPPPHSIAITKQGNPSFLPEFTLCLLNFSLLTHLMPPPSISHQILSFLLIQSFFFFPLHDCLRSGSHFMPEFLTSS